MCVCVCVCLMGCTSPFACVGAEAGPQGRTNEKTKSEQTPRPAAGRRLTSPFFGPHGAAHAMAPSPGPPPAQPSAAPGAGLLDLDVECHRVVRKG